MLTKIFCNCNKIMTYKVKYLQTPMLPVDTTNKKNTGCLQFKKIITK